MHMNNRFMWHSFISASVATLAPLSTACSTVAADNDAAESNKSLGEPIPALLQLHSTSDTRAAFGGPRVVRDGEGREWAMRPAPASSRAPDEEFAVESGTEELATPEETHDFRAVKFVDGYEYTERETSAEFEHARAAFRAHGGGYLLPGTKGEVTEPKPRQNGDQEFKPTRLGAIVPTDIATPQLLIIGTDNRNYSVSPTENIAPWYVNKSRSPHVFFAGCSGTMIGEYTAISAAHCFYDRPTSTSTGGWNYTRINGEWGVGRIRTTSSTTYTYGPAWGCYSVTIPAWFMNAPTDDQAYLDDFAIVQFGCGLYPGTNNSYPPAYYNAAGYASARVTSFRAYDATGADPVYLPNGLVPSHGSNTFRVQTLMERSVENFGSGSTMVLQSNQVRLLGGERIDVAGGASGGGLIQTVFSNVGDHTPCFVGNEVGIIHPAGRIYATSGTTAARAGFRVVTAGSWGFIVANASEF